MKWLCTIYISNFMLAFLLCADLDTGHIFDMRKVPGVLCPPSLFCVLIIVSVSLPLCVSLSLALWDSPFPLLLSHEWGQRVLSSLLDAVGVTNGNMALPVARSTNSKQSEGGERKWRGATRREMKRNVRGLPQRTNAKGQKSAWRYQRSVYIFLTAWSSPLVTSLICLHTFKLIPRLMWPFSTPKWTNFGDVKITNWCLSCPILLLYQLEINIRKTFRLPHR